MAWHPLMYHFVTTLEVCTSIEAESLAFPSDAGSLGSLSLAGGWAHLSVPVIIWPLPRGRWGITLPQPRRDTTTRMRGWRSASTSQTGDIEIPATGSGFGYRLKRSLTVSTVSNMFDNLNKSFRVRRSSSQRDMAAKKNKFRRYIWALKSKMGKWIIAYA